MKNFILLFAIFAFGSVSASGVSNTNFKASSSITSVCAISIGDIDLGDVKLITTNNLSTGLDAGFTTLNVLCTKNTPYTVSQIFNDPVPTNLEPTNDPYGYLRSTQSSDYMIFGLGYTLNGTLYNWGKNPISSSGTGANQTYSINTALANTQYYASVAYPTPGVYMGSATITLTY